MALNAKEKEYTGGKRVDQPALEAGTYPARVVQVIDLGVQEQDPYQGQDPKPPIQKLMITYELADEFIVDEEGDEVKDKPRWLSEEFPLHNLESDLATSTKRYYAIDPDCESDGDWTKLLGAPVMLTIVQNIGKGKNAGRIFNKIKATSTMRKKEAEKLPELQNPGKILDLDDASTVDVLMTLPEWIQKKIKEGLEYEGSAMETAVLNYKKDDTGGKQGEKKSDKKQQKAKPEPEDEDSASNARDEVPEEDTNW